MKQKLTELREEIHHSTVTVGDIHISIMDYRTATQKTNKEIDDSSTLTRVNGHLYKTPCNNSRIYIFFSIHGNFLKIKKMLHHKTSLNEFKMTEIT